MMTKVKSEAEIAAMRESGRMLGAVLKVLKNQLKPGMTTRELAEIAKKELKSLGGQPAFLGYYGFPDVLCASVNEEVVHGIPSDRIIEEGDIVGLDFGVVYKGMITDGAISIIAGRPRNADEARLLKMTEAALMAGIDTVKAGVHTGTIGSAIESVLSKENFGIVRDLVGHGVGHELHEDPNIPNYGHKGSGPALKAGMTVAIEPMATLGGEQVVIGGDKWTVSTADGSRAAHFEHTVLVTAGGAEILTA